MLPFSRQADGLDRGIENRFVELAIEGQTLQINGERLLGYLAAMFADVHRQGLQREDERWRRCGRTRRVLGLRGLWNHGAGNKWAQGK